MGEKGEEKVIKNENIDSNKMKEGKAEKETILNRTNILRTFGTYSNNFGIDHCFTVYSEDGDWVSVVVLPWLSSSYFSCCLLLIVLRLIRKVTTLGEEVESESATRSILDLVARANFEI